MKKSMMGFTVFYIVPIALKLMDYGSSILLLSMPEVGAVEANPFTAYLLGIHPVFALAVSLIVQVELCYAMRWSWSGREDVPVVYRDIHTSLFVVAFVVMAVPVVNNLFILGMVLV